MAGRNDKKKGGATAAPAGGRQSQFFISGDGIDREVITTDICRYLGNDALVRPGKHTDPNGRVQEGFYITAYRPPTSAQLADLRRDSQRWSEERRNNRPGGYTNSAVRREVWDDPPEEQPPQTTGVYSSTVYGGMPSGQQPTQMTQQTRSYPEPSRGGYGSQPQMQPPLTAGPYNRDPPIYPNTGVPNYTFAQPAQTQVAYGVEPSRERADPIPPPRNIPQNPPYTSPGMPQVTSGYGPGRGAGFSGYPLVGNPAIPAGYRADPMEPPRNPDPYPAYDPRDAGTPQEEPTGYDYPNDEEMYDEPQAAAPPAAPQRRERDRDSHETSGKHRRHR